MKKISMGLSALVMALALGACSGGNDTAKTDAAAPASASTGALSPEAQVEARGQNMKAIAKANKSLRAMAEGKEGFDDAKMKEAVALLDIQHFITFSSTASALGSAGQTSYAMANGFVDGLAAWRRWHGLRSLNINWSAWTIGFGATIKQVHP